jgi:hypothetical protein
MVTALTKWWLRGRRWRRQYLHARRQNLDEVRQGQSMAAAGCARALADKRLDLACIGTATANLKWYENLPAK